MGGLIHRLLGRGVTGPATTDAGLLVCVFRRNMSAPPVRQAPTIHGVQLVSPSRLCSGRLSVCSWSFESASFGGILSSPAGGRNDSLAARSCSSSRSSCFAFRAAAPARPAATFLGSLTFCLGSVTLSTGLCAGSSACVLLCNFSAIVDSNWTLMSKSTVLHGGQKGR